MNCVILKVQNDRKVAIPCFSRMDFEHLEWFL